MPRGIGLDSSGDLERVGTEEGSDDQAGYAKADHAQNQWTYPLIEAGRYSDSIDPQSCGRAYHGPDRAHPDHQRDGASASVIFRQVRCGKSILQVGRIARPEHEEGYNEQPEDSCLTGYHGDPSSDDAYQIARPNSPSSAPTFRPQGERSGGNSYSESACRHGDTGQPVSLDHFAGEQSRHRGHCDETRISESAGRHQHTNGAPLDSLPIHHRTLKDSP
jgi:hypothetical protein